MKVDRSLVTKTDQNQRYTPPRRGPQPAAWSPARPTAQTETFVFGTRHLSAQQVLGGILLLATILRVSAALLHGNSLVGLPGIYDQISYDGLARRVLDGYGFSFARTWWPITPAGEPTAHWSYLYTLYIAAVYTIFGPQPLVARLIQAVIVGLLHSWLVWRVGRHIFGPAVGLVAAASSAVYLYFVYYTGALLTETFYIIGILWTFDSALGLVAATATAQAQDEQPAPNWWRWGMLGLAIGVTALLRQLFLLFVPFLFLWLWWRLRAPRVTNTVRLHRPATLPLLKGLLLTTSIIVLCILPWTIRNYRVFGTVTPLNTNAGYAFFWGNHPIYGTQFVGILPDDGPDYRDLIPAELRHLNEAELDRALLKVGIGFVVADPVRYVRLSLSRTREYFKFWPAPASGLVSNLARVGSFGIFLPWMLYGLWVASKNAWQNDDPQQRGGFWLLVLFITIYTGIHLLTWALIRYRLPVDAILLIFAAVGLVQLGNHYRASSLRFRRE